MKYGAGHTLLIGVLLIRIAVIAGGEGFEIVFPFKDTGGFDHTRFIERIRMMMYVAPLEGRADFASKQRVTVGFRDGVEARVETRMRLGGAEDADGGRQKPVHGAPQIIGGYRILDGERSHLRQR